MSAHGWKGVERSGKEWKGVERSGGKSLERSATCTYNSFLLPTNTVGKWVIRSVAIFNNWMRMPSL
jgi:hypothetical protein